MGLMIAAIVVIVLLVLCTDWHPERRERAARRSVKIIDLPPLGAGRREQAREAMRVAT